MESRAVGSLAVSGKLQRAIHLEKSALVESPPTISTEGASIWQLMDALIRPHALVVPVVE